MGKLDVNLADLSRAADDYAELQARAAAISPQAVEEVNRVIATHGPMGYPVAVGVVAGLARRQAPLEAQAAQFGEYSSRFNEHMATYSSEDQEAARRFQAIRFPAVPEADLPQNPDEEEPTIDSFQRSPRWIGTADGDTSACGESTTEYVYVEDGHWMNRQVDGGYVSQLAPNAIADQTLLPGPPAPGSDPFAEAWPGSSAVVWPNLDGTIGGVWRRPDGHCHVI